MAGNPEAELTNKAPSRVADHSVNPLVTRHATMLRPLTPKKGEAPLFENSDEELEHLQHKNTRFKRQCKIDHLCAQVLSKKTHQRGESLDTLTKPLAPKWPTPVILSTMRSTVLLLDYGGHKRKDPAHIICRVKNMLKFDAAIYLTEMDCMMFAKL
jgi:hypothetical protein